ncbi:hypothetical protein RM697_12835 [Ichthyenterobacterium sp. W332]|uniref:Bro-N domain-containing protein n=1 Tax=Microcosmobacter mediterraneus TaxID=3075607 RepID=A0ABU2YNB9_9FLAO|nr:hypothetical protein [Ichthyenterobacterium sp. W332]MDT0559542.1 hypothetical protein [Ichthyenterobacterium sp. W332]
MTNFILNFKSLGSKLITRMDFNSEKPATEFIELTKLNGYKMYQYIQSGNNYVMTAEELEMKNIKFEKLLREVKTWFGLSKKTVTDFLIMPDKSFYYPYEFGSYLYIFTKQNRTKVDFENWLDKEFPSRFGHIDETFTGFENLMDDEDYLIATNHDLQHQFGVVGNKNIIDQIITEYKNANLREFELDDYEEKP